MILLFLNWLQELLQLSLCVEVEKLVGIDLELYSVVNSVRGDLNVYITL